MKKLFLLVFLGLGLHLYADKFEIPSFNYSANSQIALRAPRYDQNKQACALLLISTPLRDVRFQTNPPIVGDIRLKMGRFYVYVPISATSITISKDGFEPLEYNIPISLRPSAVYDVTLKGIITEKPAEPVVAVAEETEAKPEPPKQEEKVIAETPPPTQEEKIVAPVKIEKEESQKENPTLEETQEAPQAKVEEKPIVEKPTEETPKEPETSAEEIEKKPEAEPEENTSPPEIVEDVMLTNDIPLRSAPEIERMVFVQGGCFNMGSHFGSKDELPVHKVCVDDFYIGKYEVTLKEYVDFLNAIGCEPDGKKDNQKLVSIGTKIKFTNNQFVCNEKDENLPATTVTWYGAKAYAEWAGGRLPTEAEWEYAARGGLKMKNTTYAGNDSIYDVALYSRNSGNRPHPVGTKAPNELGIYDMSGNAYEWVADMYHEGYYAKSPEKNPEGSPFGKARVLRGGSFGDKDSDCRVANRHKFTPANSFYFFGFRIVKPLPNNP